MSPNTSNLLGRSPVRTSNPRWVTNPIAAQRRNGEWIIQVNFEDINKAFHQESYLSAEEQQALPGVPQRRNGEWIIQVNFEDINKAFHQESYLSVEEQQALPGVQTQTRRTQEELEKLKAFLSKGVRRSPSLHKIRNEVISNMSYKWNKEAETSFQRWKDCMETVPMVMPPTRGEALFLHIAASSDEIGAMLFAEQRHLQIPIYFVSRTLPEVEKSYEASEKLILALIHATRRLRRYFKDHPIRVLTDKPFERTFLKPDGARRVVKWAKELEEYDIEYGENDPFEGQSNEPAETCESSTYSNKKVFQVERKEKQNIGSSKMCLIQKKEEYPEFGAEQQASTK
ncbi:reverse transcriptase domain-containing protein [Artemisia annua]|uniref:Reverse transcriptase domain-containing protein n=1 Tax=Artemisia annua TaxID=35608 RepID=A0A2U1LZF6_ARTAN|nr:reverse transcriptase domain-containing protein [Artemisia annua]